MKIFSNSTTNLLTSKLPPVKRVALFLRPKAMKQRKHDSANVSFCDPVQSTGFPKRTMNIDGGASEVAQLIVSLVSGLITLKPFHLLELLVNQRP